MLKLKQADYVVLHRIVTGLTSRRLWERSAVHAVFAADPDVPPRRLGQVLHLDVAPVQAILEAGPQWLEQVRQSVPEEFLDWITETMTLQQQQVSDIMAAVDVTVAQLAGVPRKEVAARIGADPNRAMIFAALDHRSILAQAWAAVRPSADRPFAARGEDVA
jgi:RNA ligase